MTRLTDLPDELLNKVAPHLSASWPGDTGQPNLHGLCLTSRRFNRIATPHLYRIARPHKAGVFVKTMYDRPPLAAHVKCLDWMKCVAGDDEHALVLYFIDFIRKTKITPEEAEANPVPFQLFIDDRGRNVFGCITDILLTLLPNLEELVVGHGCTAFDGGSLFKRLEKFPQYIHFPTLRRLSYFTSPAYDGPDATSIVPILAMSNATELYLRRCISIESDAFAGVFNLREIVLESCGFTLPDLEPLIQRTPDLTFFRYQAAHSDQAPVAGDIFIRLSEILTCLQPVETRLEKLHVHLHCHHGYGPQRGDRDEGALESLQHFTNLKELEICQSDLTIGMDPELSSDDDTEVEVNGDYVEADEDDQAPINGYRFVHKMPQSLERLAIMNANAYLLPELDYLAHDNGEDLPNLKYVWICGHNFDELNPAFRKWDVQFKSRHGMRALGPFGSWF